MAVYIEHTDNIIAIRYAGIITRGDLLHAYEAVLDCLDAHPHYCIIDVTEVMYTPQSIETIRNTGKKYSYIDHPRTIATFYILPDGEEHLCAEAIYDLCAQKKVLHKTYLCASTEEATCIIDNHCTAWQCGPVPASTLG
ncbi:MAG: hypothetical protein AAGK74_15020 [Chloroflexota bacterium]